MSCNRCATTAEAVAPVAGAAHIEAGWSENRDHPQQCDQCGAFLRADGGCTKCEGTGVSSDARTLAQKQQETPPEETALACGHQAAVSAGPGEEVWCPQCDDWTTVTAPTPPVPAGGSSATPGADDLPETEYGRAAYHAQHDPTRRPTAQAKVKQIGYGRVTAALRSAGVPAAPAATRQRIRNMVWQYLDRCGQCKAWISPQNPVCRNPRCGDKGKTVGQSRPWPPADVVWVQRKQDVGFEVEGTTSAASPASGVSSDAQSDPLRSLADELSIDSDDLINRVSYPDEELPPSGFDVSVGDTGQFLDQVVNDELTIRNQATLSQAEKDTWGAVIEAVEEEGRAVDEAALAATIATVRALRK